MIRTHAVDANAHRAGVNTRFVNSWRTGISLLLLIVCMSFLLIVNPFARRSETAAARNAQAVPTAVRGADADQPPWHISGALTEACTCRVPCTCNFGEGPSPHSYCYAFFSYFIEHGTYQDVVLDGMHLGAADLENARTIFIDERANPQQRAALTIIAARVIERAKPDEMEQTLRDLKPNIRYVKVIQTYDAKENKLEIPGVGLFQARYIMGLDKTQPVVVHNNTTWRVKDTIKAKTTIYRIKVGRDTVNLKNTNSNQGEFDFSSETDFSSGAEWSCGGIMTAPVKRAHAVDPVCAAGPGRRR